MSKPFNIHDWQDKQRRLSEADDRPYNWRELPGYNPGTTSKQTPLEVIAHDDNQLYYIDPRDIETYIHGRMVVAMEKLGSPSKELTRDNSDATQGGLRAQGFADTSAAGLVPGDPNWPGEDDRDNFPNPEDLVGEGKIGDNSYKTRCLILGKDTEVFIDNSNTLDDVTIRWRGANHWGNKTFEHLKFEADSVIDDHGNEGKDMSFIAISEDENWIFMVDVYVEASYEMSGNIGDWDWDTLEIDHIDDDSKIEPELDEQNTVASNTGFSFQKGAGEGYMTPNAFNNKRKRKLKEQDDDEDQIPPVEPEELEEPEEIKVSKDVELILRYISRINLKSEWVELFTAIVDLEIRGLSTAVKLQTIRQKVQSISQEVS